RHHCLREGAPVSGDGIAQSPCLWSSEGRPRETARQSRKIIARAGFERQRVASHNPTIPVPCGLQRVGGRQQRDRGHQRRDRGHGWAGAGELVQAPPVHPCRPVITSSILRAAEPRPCRGFLFAAVSARSGQRAASAREHASTGRTPRSAVYRASRVANAVNGRRTPIATAPPMTEQRLPARPLSLEGRGTRSTLGAAPYFFFGRYRSVMVPS